MKKPNLSWVESLIKFNEKYSLWSVIKAMITAFIITFTVYICTHPEFIFDRFDEYAKKKHDIELYNRSEHDTDIKLELPILLNKYHASRVFIIQYHNGTKDWQHGTMRFELWAEHSKSMKDQYVDFNLTWLNMPYYLKEHEWFIGTIDELKLIDKVLYDQLKPYEVDYAAFIILRNTDNLPCGILGFTWPKTSIDLNTMRQKIHDYMITDRAKIQGLI